MTLPASNWSADRGPGAVSLRARVTLPIAVASTAICGVISTAGSAASSSFGGWANALRSRLVVTLMAVAIVILSLTLLVVFRPSVRGVTITFGVTLGTTG